MTADLLPPELAGLLASRAPGWEQAAGIAEAWSRPEVLAAFAAGAAAVFCGARLLLLAVGLLGAAHLGVEFGIVETAPAWLLPLCVGLALLGILQGVVTVFAGAETFGDLLLMALAFAGALAAFVLWKVPAALVARAFRRGDLP